MSRLDEIRAAQRYRRAAGVTESSSADIDYLLGEVDRLSGNTSWLETVLDQNHKAQDMAAALDRVSALAEFWRQGGQRNAGRLVVEASFAASELRRAIDGPSTEEGGQ